MKIIEEGSPNRGFMVVFSTYKCLNCAAIFEIESREDADTLEPECSLVASMLDNWTEYFSGICPCCGVRSDLKRYHN